ncbi:hypothetical protein P8631_08830 [Guyparkeria sp. 1SP6A2]|nr:hypothetical protein [Guyparkeria sp. 1SP6A2]
MPNPLLDRISPANRNSAVVLLALLALSMLATRYHHFSSALHLADTSWAAFFLAGLLIRRVGALVGLLALAVAIDLGSVVLDGAAMASCFSPAYPGVLVAYTALWGAGRLTAHGLAVGRPGGQIGGVLLIGLGILSGALAAFAISNATFYAFSGQFDQLAMMDYIGSTAGYFSGYLASAAGYTAVGLLGMAAANLIGEMHRHARRHS